MGAGNSKQTAPDSSQYVFAADSPVSFSSSVVDSLQSSPETDSVRSRNLELQVQSRVTAELERIRDAEAADLTSTTESLTPTTDDTPSSSSPDTLTGKIADAVTPNALKSSSSARSNASVSKEVAELKAKLEKRKNVDKADPAVEKAKDGLVQCLRVKDRRPLDCWAEVQAFKTEVAKLEQKFVDKALR